VVIEILICGVCHSDLHTTRDDWGWTAYPIVPGHEIIGRVVKVGRDVTRFKPGDHVGVGCLVDSCGTCDACESGEERYCDGAVCTYGGQDRHDHSKTQGGYSEKVVVSEAFVLRIPDGLDLKGAAPLLCAGITTWSPLRHWQAGKGSRVAVVGLGRLGHMALKLAKALGAEVTLFDRFVIDMATLNGLGVVPRHPRGGRRRRRLGVLQQGQRVIEGLDPVQPGRVDQGREPVPNPSGCVKGLVLPMGPPSSWPRAYPTALPKSGSTASADKDPGRPDSSVSSHSSCAGRCPAGFPDSNVLVSLQVEPSPRLEATGRPLMNL
jgi:hypothetical protein